MWQGSVVGSVMCAFIAYIACHRTVLKATAAEPEGDLVSESVAKVKNTLN